MAASQLLAGLIAVARNVAIEGSRNPKNPTDANSHLLRSSVAIQIKMAKFNRFLYVDGNGS
jgi:hypothetical protein